MSKGVKIALVAGGVIGIYFLYSALNKKPSGSSNQSPGNASNSDGSGWSGAVSSLFNAAGNIFKGAGSGVGKNQTPTAPGNSDGTGFTDSQGGSAGSSYSGSIDDIFDQYNNN